LFLYKKRNLWLRKPDNESLEDTLRYMLKLDNLKDNKNVDIEIFESVWNKWQIYLDLLLVLEPTVSQKYNKRVKLEAKLETNNYNWEDRNIS
jgi:hypothetical protein